METVMMVKTNKLGNKSVRTPVAKSNVEVFEKDGWVIEKPKRTETKMEERKTRE